MQSRDVLLKSVGSCGSFFRAQVFAPAVPSRIAHLHYGAGPVSPADHLSTSALLCLKHFQVLPNPESLVSQLSAWLLPQTPTLSSVPGVIANLPHQEQLLILFLLLWLLSAHLSQPDLVYFTHCCFLHNQLNKQKQQLNKQMHRFSHAPDNLCGDYLWEIYLVFFLILQNKILY